MKTTKHGRARRPGIAKTLHLADGSIAKWLTAACCIALVLAFLIIRVETRRRLQKTCESVTRDFSAIMQSYTHSFLLFEKLLQHEIETAADADEIEAFLKRQDPELLKIEGGDYDGVYMYYQGRYLYSWATPFSVYEGSGYDATNRPWYKGARKAGGEVFFSIPYPSYANDYMLSTISRLQPDGETVIAYDIKLGQIGSYVDRLDIYNGALTLICDANGDILGSTNRLYQGGNYRRTDEALAQSAALAERELSEVQGDNAKAARKLESLKAQQAFCHGARERLTQLADDPETLRFHAKTASFGYAYQSEGYTCFVLVPLYKLLPHMGLVWAALCFGLLLLALLAARMLRQNSLALTDGLTGLNNRRALYKYCAERLQHGAEENLCLIMLDLNHFKKINDRFGHVVGDQALRDAADALKKTCAQAPCSLFLCRYGGDEFLLAGAGMDANAASAVTALLRAQFEAKNQQSGAPYTLEVGVGVAIGTPEDGKDIERLLVEADQAMYQDKIRLEQEQCGGKRE